MTDLHIFAKREGLRDTDWERPFELYDWGNNRGLVILTSRDLLNWQKTYINFTEIPGFENVGCVWAPELTWDEGANSFLMHYTTRFGNGHNEIYAAHLSIIEDGNVAKVSLAEKPFPLFSAPRDETGKTNYNVIDSDIVRTEDGVYHLLYVSHEKGACIHQAISKSLTGPYTDLGRVQDGEKRGHEAPNCWQRPDGTWVLMWDCYGRKPHNFGFAETKDFKEWKPIGYFDQKDGVMKRTGFAEQKHGSVVVVSGEMLKSIEGYNK